MSQILSLTESFFPEARVGGFTNVDGTLAFYSQIAALVRPDSVILEFGAGRGANIAEIKSDYLRHLQSFKGRCAKVVGCDVDAAVLANPYIDEAHVISPDGPLPFEDNSFDLVVSSWVFEHIENAELMAKELLRVTKPGGFICACTPNKFGYVAMAARLVKNSQHVRLLSRIQPDRKSVDIFPTAYKLNTVKDLVKAFSPQGEVIVGRTSAEPSYHFNNKLIYMAFLAIHKIFPKSLSTTLHVYIRKAG